MKRIFNIEEWINNPEKRMRLIRIIYFLSYGMLLLGFILIILSFMYPDFLR